jgi:fatty-acyl-CoA synthase
MEPMRHPFWPPGVPDVIAPPDGTLWQYLERSAQRWPDKPAFVFYGAELSYRALRQQSERLAGYLQQRCGVQRGDRVLLMSQNCPQFAVAYYAILRANAVVVPVNAMWTADEVGHVIGDSDAKVAIVAQEFVARVQPSLREGRLRRVLAIRYADALSGAREPGLRVPSWLRESHAVPVDPNVVAWHDARAADLSPAPHGAQKDDLAVLPYTSGTTGRPKGCMHTHATVQSANLASIVWRAQGPDLVHLAVAPLFHMLGMQNGMNVPIATGATVVMLPRWDRDAALALIERYRVTNWGAPPMMLADFFDNPNLEGRDVSSLKTVFGGSAVMPEALAKLLRERFGISYQEGYGLTETASFFQANPPQRAKLNCLGIPGPGVETRIIDPVSKQPLPRGEVGEIAVRGPQVMLGYWNDPQANREAFVELDGKRFLRTGDLGCADAEGYFFMRDRLKRMINVSGYKVWPAEVESLLIEHPAISEACVIARPDAKQGESVKAVVVLKEGYRGRLSADQLITWARERMAVYKAPRHVEFADSLPKSNTGKVLWRELQEREGTRNA